MFVSPLHDEPRSELDLKILNPPVFFFSHPFGSHPVSTTISKFLKIFNFLGMPYVKQDVVSHFLVYRFVVFIFSNLSRSEGVC